MTPRVLSALGDDDEFVLGFFGQLVILAATLRILVVVAWAGPHLFDAASRRIVKGQASRD